MATWSELKSFILANYKVRDDSGEMLSMSFGLDGGRQQTVVVSLKGEVAGTHWAEISTAVAKESQVNYRDLLVRNSEMVCGGLALLEMANGENLVLFRHSIPLGDLDPSEFEGPLGVAVVFGDRLEQELSGSDTF